MAVEPLYQSVKPKILLVNFTTADADALAAKNYNIERGWATKHGHSYPSPGYEYDIVIARFDTGGFNEARALTQYGSSDTEDYGYIATTLDGAGFALIFTGEENLTTLYSAGISELDTLTLDQRDTQYIIASENKNSVIDGHNFSLGLLQREKDRIVRPVTLGLTWQKNDKQPIFALAENAASQTIAAIGTRRNEHWNPDAGEYNYTYSPYFIVFPAVSEGYARISADVLSQLPAWRPEIFPSDENYSWLESEAYWSTRMLKERDEIGAIQTEYESHLDEQKERYFEARAADQWMKQLLIADDSSEFPEGSKLTDACIAALEFLGFTAQSSDKEMKGGSRREDIACSDGDYKALVECKGTVNQNPPESHVSQLLNHLVAKKADKGILIINHDRKRDAFARALPYEGSPHVLEYEAITIVPTVELFKLVRAVESGNLQKEKARGLLKAQGRFQYPQSATDDSMPGADTDA